MAFLPLRIPPGMSKSDTEYATKGRWWDGNLVRWIRGVLQPIGNWTVGSISPGVADPRAAHSWMVTGGTRYVALAGGVVSNPTSLTWDPIPTPVVGVHSDTCPDASTTINVTWGFRPASPAATDVIKVEYRLNNGDWVTLDDDLAYNTVTFAHVNPGFYPAGEATPDAIYLFVYRVSVYTSGAVLRATRTGTLTLPVKLCYHFDTCTVTQGTHVDTCPDVSSTLDLDWTLSATPPVGDHIRVRGRVDSGAWSTLTDALANDAVAYAHAMTGWFPAGEGQTGVSRTYSYEVLVLDTNDNVVTTSGVVSKVVQVMTCDGTTPIDGGGNGITVSAITVDAYSTDAQCPGSCRWLLTVTTDPATTLPVPGYTLRVRRKIGAGGSWSERVVQAPVNTHELVTVDSLDGYISVGSATGTSTALTWEAYVTRDSDGATISTAPQATYTAYLQQCIGGTEILFDPTAVSAGFWDTVMVCPGSAYGYVNWALTAGDSSGYTVSIEYDMDYSGFQSLATGLTASAGNYGFAIPGYVVNRTAGLGSNIPVVFKLSLILTAAGTTADYVNTTVREEITTCG